MSILPIFRPSVQGTATGPSTPPSLDLDDPAITGPCNSQSVGGPNNSGPLPEFPRDTTVPNRTVPKIQPPQRANAGAPMRTLMPGASDQASTPSLMHMSAWRLPWQTSLGPLSRFPLSRLSRSRLRSPSLPRFLSLLCPSRVLPRSPPFPPLPCSPPFPPLAHSPPFSPLARSPPFSPLARSPPFPPLARSPPFPPLTRFPPFPRSPLLPRRPALPVGCPILHILSSPLLCRNGPALPVLLYLS